MSANSTPVPLLTPYKMGRFELSHRVVMPPMTRNRSYNNTPQPHAIEYYAQRATNGGFLISESASASDISQGGPNMPGIWTEEQKEAWKPIVDSVHQKGGIFFCQIWHPGRIPHSGLDNFLLFWRAVPDDKEYIMPTPQQLRANEVPHIIEDFRIAARNAIKAGFDGVEINSSNGFIIDQFLNDQANDRTDEYGGSIENRCRLALEIIEAVVKEIGADKVGIKLSLFSELHGEKDSNLEPLATYLAKELTKLGILYLHAVEPREAPRCLESIRMAFEGTLISSGGYDKTEGDEAIAENYADLISFGRLFLANPDLPNRFEVNAPLNKHDRSTFYMTDPVVGYTDYPSLQVAC
ncbi:12-oxophytodienoate reductase-like protein [Nicotiana tabacum]|uniref:12-oxophytodienoate reductase 2 n=1 Tax=Nicotiana tabacum TaxID=4097 RepID=V9TJ19_TOBAC|nr:12-oxophytodienoate reductase-like protein [Nicotiana tabacum]AHC69826.1 12-oxophytodienoate reductase 2 [Nicotiana tabacum]